MVAGVRGRDGGRGKRLGQAPEVRAAAIAAALGFDAWRYLTAGPFERSVLDAVLARTIELVEQRDQNQANRISNNLVKILR